MDFRFPPTAESPNTNPVPEGEGLANGRRAAVEARGTARDRSPRLWTVVVRGSGARMRFLRSTQNVTQLERRRAASWEPALATWPQGAYVLELALVVTAYFLGAKVGLHLAYANKNVTAVWPPTGIALAALLLLGVRIWPAIALGAFLSNLSNGAGADTSVLITIGNTLAPLVAWWLVRRVARLEARLERVSDVAGVLLLGGPLSMAVSATLGSTALWATGALHGSTYGFTWLTWWIGDAMGVVIVAPLLLLAATRPWRSKPLHGWHGMEALGALICLGAVSGLTFTNSKPLIFLILPVAAWGAVRFFQLGAGVVVGVVAALSITLTVNGIGPWAHGLSTTGSLITLQAFNGSLALTTLMLAAAALQNSRTQRSLREDAAELEEILRQERLAALNDMTAVVAHDLRTPLATIMTSHYLLRDQLGTDLDGEALTCLELAEQESARALELVERLRDYRKVKRLSLSQVSLRALIDRSVEAAPPPQAVSLSIDCGDILVRVDPGQMVQVLTNLLVNAYESMGDAGTVEVLGAAAADTVMLSVGDSGRGFDDAVIGRAFDPFFSTKSSGTGLGLAIVRRLVEMHGGHATVENRPGSGALVTVLLPRGDERTTNGGANATMQVLGRSDRHAQRGHQQRQSHSPLPT